MFLVVEGKVSKPKIFEYTRYREYLRDYYEFMKSQPDSEFSFRTFSRAAGFSSASVLKLVIEGKRNLSVESIQKFSKALGLNQAETEFFNHLVNLNQAKNLDSKRFYAEQLLKSRQYRKLNPLKPAQFEYFSKWFYVAVRELVGTEDFVEDPAWIAEALTPQITPAEAKDALETLAKLGLTKRDESGRLVLSDSALSSGDDVDSASLSQFHREMIQKGSESIERFRGNEREVTSLTFGVDQATADEVKELVRRFKKELSAILVNAKTSEEVYQFNMQFFPLSDRSRKRGIKSRQEG